MLYGLVKQKVTSKFVDPFLALACRLHPLEVTLGTQRIPWFIVIFSFQRPIPHFETHTAQIYIYINIYIYIFFFSSSRNISLDICISYISSSNFEAETPQRPRRWEGIPPPGPGAAVWLASLARGGLSSLAGTWLRAEGAGALGAPREVPWPWRKKVEISEIGGRWLTSNDKVLSCSLHFEGSYSISHFFGLYFWYFGSESGLIH